MLAVPLKATKGVDFSGPLRAFMLNNYDAEELDKHASSIQRLDTTRERVANVSGAAESSVDALESYLGMLSQLEPRFPLGEGGLKISFTWFDALKPSKKLSMSQVAFERASVLFNLAAVLSHQGMVQDRSDVTSLKKACLFFQKAAGIFGQLKEMTGPSGALQGPTLTDMSGEGLDMLYYLMLAQAQACFYEKALRDEYKAALLAKLSAKALEWYERAWQSSQSSLLSSTLDPAWAAHLEFQLRCFQASSQFQYSKVVHERAQETTKGYGEEIARLGLASEMCSQAIGVAQRGRLPQNMLGTVEQMRTTIHRRMDEASDANNKIYMDVIPKARTLDAPPSTALAKALPPADGLLFAANIADTLGMKDDVMEDRIFAGLLPVVMQEAEAMYKSKLSHMIETYGAKVERAAEQVKLQLQEAGLPQAVEAGDQSKDGLPDVVWARVQSCNGSGALRDGVAGIATLALGFDDKLREVESKLNEEEVEDERCRQTWGDLWTVSRSSELSTHMRRDLSRYRSLIREARASDTVLSSKLDAALPRMEILGYSRAQLDRLFPSAEDVNNGDEVEATRVELALMLVELGANISECELLQGRLVDEVGRDSIAGAMARAPGGPSAVASSSSKVEALVEREAGKYADELRAIDRHIGEQPTYLNKVLEKNFNFSHMRNQSEASLKREGLIAEIDQAIRVHSEIATFIIEGEQFYTNLSARIEKLNTTALDHAYVRGLQRQEMEEDLVQRNSGGGDGDGGSGSGSGSGGQSDGGSYPNRGNLNRAASRPFLTPYVVGGAAAAYPIDAQPAPSGSAPPPAYAAAVESSSGREENINGESASERRAKLQAMRSTLGSDVPQERMDEALDGAGGDVNTAINHLLAGMEQEEQAFASAAAGAGEGNGKKRHSKKRFGLF